MTIQEKVEQRLKSGKSITPAQCLEFFGGMRLAVIIDRMRKKGFDVKTIITQGKNRFKEKVTFATYRLVTD